MKNYMLLIAGLLLFAFGCNQKPATEEVFTTTIGIGTPYYATPETLNGKVKELREKIYLAVEQEGKYVKGERMDEETRNHISWTQSYVAHFDAQGNLLKCAYVNEQDKVLTHNAQEIVNGTPVKMTTFNGDTLRMITNISHDAQENATMFERIRMPEDTLVNNVLVAYDASGSYKSWEFTNPAGEVTYRWEFSSPEDGSSVTYKVYNNDGEKVGERTEYLNDHGFSEKDVMVNRAGEETVIDMEYTYDNRGNWTSRVITSPDTMVIEGREITYFEE
jgi:hypothetical protein